jgi:hypothetical protein
MKVPIVAFILTVLIHSSALAQQDRLAIQVQTDAVRVTGASPGGEVVFFSIGRGTDGYTTLIRRVLEVRPDSDRDGEVVLRPSRGVLPRSIWVAIDATRGQTAIGAPERYRIKHAAGSRRLGRGAQTGLIDEFETPGGMVDVLYVHPIHGIWAGRIGDGQSEDHDGRADARLKIRLADLKTLSPGKERPADFAPGGVLVTIDRYTMQVFASRADSLLGDVGLP